MLHELLWVDVDAVCAQHNKNLHHSTHKTLLNFGK